MLKLIKCEFWKLKRKRLLYALMSLSLFFPLILAYMAKAGTGADTTEHYLQTRFDYVYTMMLGYGLVFLLPCLIGIIAAILFFIVLIVAASLPIVFLIIYFNKSFLLSILLAFFYSIFNWGILGTIGTSISAAKIAFLNSFPVICVMNWTSGLMMDNLQKDNLLPEAYAIVPTTCHTIFIMAITVILSLWLIIRFYKKWTR